LADKFIKVKVKCT